MNELSKSLMEKMFQDRRIRTEITKQSHWYFFHFYFAHYVKYKTAPFQNEIFRLTEDENVKNLFIVAFRGCGKSTILTTSYPIWAILGKQQKKFVLILCQTQAQAKQHLMNLRRELESNQVLKNDLGPFKEESNEWGSLSLVFSKLGARITAASTEQSIRGLRHNQHRPDLIIGDDIEDMASTRTKESRKKTYDWLTGEVIPAGDRDTKLVIVGNLLHEDSLLMRIKEDVEKDRIDGVFKEYPLIDDKDKVLWPGKYPLPENIEEEKRKCANIQAWLREYMLKIVSDHDQAIFREWIQYYDKIPDIYHLISIRVAVDPAISQRTSADCTAILVGLVFEEDDKETMYILPTIINERMTFPETLEKCKWLNEKLSEDHDDWYPVKFYIEAVAYQKALAQMLDAEGLDVTEVSTTTEKRARLALTGNIVKSGQVLFPRENSNLLINQMVHLGTEKHDDLADAFSTLALSLKTDPELFCGFITVINH